MATVTHLCLLVHGDLQLLLKLAHRVLSLFLAQLGQLMLLPAEGRRQRPSDLTSRNVTARDVMAPDVTSRQGPGRHNAGRARLVWTTLVVGLVPLGHLCRNSVIPARQNSTQKPALAIFSVAMTQFR